MKLKRFEALTLQGALRSVKAELGPDAVIVSTRRVHKGGGLFGLLSQPVVEVTAAIDRTKESKKPDFPNWGWGQEPNKINTVVNDPVPSPEQTEKETSFDDQLRIATMLDPLTQQLTALSDEFKQFRQERESSESVIGPLRQELEGLRIVVGEALGDRTRKRVESLPGDLAKEYEALIMEGVQPQLAHDLLRSVAETLGTAGLADQRVVKDLLRERMEDSISVSSSIVPTGNLQKIVMLVGPTGVGKTTTIAKLASLALQADRPCKTVLITLDTYRVAAVEQLRVFAKILKVPLEVAVSPEDLTACVDRHRNADLILIDTAGRSPRDQEGQRELAAIVQQNLRMEIHLVLSAPTTETLLLDVVRRYQGLPIHRLLISKLDEAKHFGSLLNILQSTGLPLSYLSTGQRVPEDLELATKSTIVNLISEKTVQESITKKPLIGATV